MPTFFWLRQPLGTSNELPCTQRLAREAEISTQKVICRLKVKLVRSRLLLSIGHKPNIKTGAAQAAFNTYLRESLFSFL